MNSFHITLLPPTIDTMHSSNETPPPYTGPSNRQSYGPVVYEDTLGYGSRSAYMDSERLGLLSNEEPKTSITMAQLLCFFMLLSITLFGISYAFCTPTEPNHEMLRRKWEAEERAHQAMRDAWNSEHQAMVMDRGTWQKERADHIREREAIAVEREHWRRERADHENRERQEKEEKRALIVWQDLKTSSSCLQYGTREYSATLANVPLGMDPLKECWKKSIDIHGRQIFPSRCDTEGMCGTVTGHWIVDFNEPACVTWWRGYENKGCVERGTHRYESVLENLQEGDNWHIMCATTPGHVQDRDFDGPTSCATSRNTGTTHGIWLVEDRNCR